MTAPLPSPFTQQDPLAGLRDIHLPPQPGFWPPAPGWWLLSALFVALVVFAGWKIFQRLRRWHRRRPYLKELDRITSETHNPNQQAAAISQLLKAAALAYHPDHHPARLTGQDWLDFLDETAPGCTFSTQNPTLEELAWNPEATASPETLIANARQWLEAH